MSKQPCHQQGVWEQQCIPHRYNQGPHGATQSWSSHVAGFQPDIQDHFKHHGTLRLNPPTLQMQAIFFIPKCMTIDLAALECIGDYTNYNGL